MTEPHRVHITALMYSGRRNPTWDGPAADVAARLGTLPQMPCPPRPKPRLGYRGLTVVLTGPDGDRTPVDIADGIVRQGTMCRRDTGRRLERDLLRMGAEILGADRLARLLADLR
ncbi:MAG: hypothetical protein AAF366_08930 [Pseudomonadota bacterium]